MDVRHTVSSKTSHLVLAVLMLFLAFTFARLFAQPERLFALSAEGWNLGLMSPVDFWPEPLAQNLPKARDHARIVAGLLLFLGLGITALIGSLVLVADPIFARLARKLLRFAQVTFFVAACWRLVQYGSSVAEFEVFDHVFFLFALAYLLGGHLRVERIWLTLAGVYFLSGLAKFNPSWLTGRIFSTTVEMLPFLPKIPWVVQIACLALLAIELFLPVFFFLKSAVARGLAFWVFIGFHAYSFFLIDYRFPVLMLGILLALRIGMIQQVMDWQQLRESFRPGVRSPLESLRTWVLILVLGTMAIGSIQWRSESVARVLSQEGRTAGLFMFDVNANCRVSLEVTRDFNGRREVHAVQHVSGYRTPMRMDPLKQSTAESHAVMSFFENGERVRLNPTSQGLFLANSSDASVELKPSERTPVYYARALLCSDTRRVCCNPRIYRGFIQRQLEFGIWQDVRLTIEADLNGWNKWFTIASVQGTSRDGVVKFELNRPTTDFPAEYHWP